MNQTERQEQVEQLDRVAARIGPIVKAWVDARLASGAPNFYLRDLEAHVEATAPKSTPGSAGRILRDLHQRGEVHYEVIDRPSSLYRLIAPPNGSPKQPAQSDRPGAADATPTESASSTGMHESAASGGHSAGVDAYREFVSSKFAVMPAMGITNHGHVSPLLFPHQRYMVDLALRKGRYALFQDTGLGKGWQILEWSRLVAEHTGRPVLVLAPLAVARQFEREAKKLGAVVRVVASAAEVGPGVNITNYHKLHKFDPSVFAGVALDESSILKSFDGTTRTALIESFKETPFRLCATATPSPNDHAELGNHAQFLGVCSYAEMLATFFVHDGESSANSGGWRLKGHARAPFWRWVASWACSLRTPRDLCECDCHGGSARA